MSQKVLDPWKNFRFRNVRWCSRWAILAIRIEVNDDVNLKMWSKISFKKRICKSIDSLIDGIESNTFPTEFFSSMQGTGIPVHCLRLKIGSQIILSRKIDSQSLCTGKRMTLKIAIKQYSWSKNNFRNKNLFRSYLPNWRLSSAIPSKISI